MESGQIVNLVLILLYKSKKQRYNRNQLQSNYLIFKSAVPLRFPNSFICLGLLAGFVTCLQEEGIRGIPVYAAGVLIPCVLLLPLFYFRMLGAGDIKVFAVLGGLTGSHGILSIIFGSFLLGAVLSLAFLISCGNLKERISYFFHYFYKYFVTHQVQSYIQKGQKAENFHFTVPILLSVMLYAGGFY